MRGGISSRVVSRCGRMRLHGEERRTTSFRCGEHCRVRKKERVDRVLRIRACTTAEMRDAMD